MLPFCRVLHALSMDPCFVWAIHGLSKLTLLDVGMRE